MTEDTDIDMTVVAGELAQDHVDLKNELRELADRLDDGDAADQWFAEQIRDILEGY